MISDSARGGAWTTAFLGLKAKTIHICGNSRALALIEKFCAITGDEVKKK